MYYFSAEKKFPIDITPDIHARSFWGENLMLVIVDLDANSILPPHSHPHEQAGYILKGNVEFTINGEHKYLGPGDMYFIPGNIEHSAKAGSNPVQLIDIFTPVREDLKSEM